jgi:hypothetical protein
MDPHESARSCLEDNNGTYYGYVNGPGGTIAVDTASRC